MLNDDVRFQIINQRFPHIWTKLRALWGQPGIDAYFKVLLNETGGSSCLGFPKDVVAALQELRATHEKSFAGESAVPLFSVAPELAGNENFPIVNERFPHIAKKLAAMWGFPRFFWFYQQAVPRQSGWNPEGIPQGNFSRAVPTDAGARPAVSGSGLSGAGYLEPEQQGVARGAWFRRRNVSPGWPGTFGSWPVPAGWYTRLGFAGIDRQ